MSDFEKGKYYGKKKYGSQKNEKNAFPSKFYNKNYYSQDKEKDNDGKKLEKQPQILIKTREKVQERSVSPKLREDSSTSATIVQPQQPVVNVESCNSHTKTMTKAMKLLDEGTLYSSTLQDYLNDCSDFLVVGVIGPQGCGKSTLMNLLGTSKVSNMTQELFANHKKSNDSAHEGIKILTETMFKLVANEQNDCKQECIFKINTEEDNENCVNTTNGIDMYITENRVILLDCQPILFVTENDELTRSDIKRGIPDSFAEHSGELQGLQHVAFLMSVCHVLIFMQDYFLDSNNIRFLYTAEMLRPPTSNKEEEYVENYPQLLIVQNKSTLVDFTPARFTVMQKIYRDIFQSTKMHLESSMGIGTGKIMETLNPSSCGEPINLFLLPEYSDDDGTYKGHPSFKELMVQLRSNIFAVTKNPITHVQLTERTWLAYCVKVWEHIKKSPFYVEYSKIVR